jgi:hypothetical protein
LLLLPLLAGSLPVAAQAEQEAAVQVHVTIEVLSFGNYDAKQGTYALDFYLKLAWDNATAFEGFNASAFEFANGQPTSVKLQAEETPNATTGLHTLWYRVMAELYSEPQYDAYPFDKQRVEIRIENEAHAAEELVFVPDGGFLGTGFEPAGWEVRGTQFIEESHAVAIDNTTYSQAHMTITLQRSVLSGVLKVILPPLAFVIISGVSFFLVGADKVATRFGLVANMAISGVMFHAAQSASLPSLSRLIFLDRYMLAIDLFLFGSVFVTALVALAEMKWKDPKRAKRINLRGIIVVPAVAVGAFLLMQLV